MSNVFVIIKMCYVHNQWYDISCATLYVLHVKVKSHTKVKICNENLLSFFLCFLNHICYYK